jgi:hypothetical protein
MALDVVLRDLAQLLVANTLFRCAVKKRRRKQFRSDATVLFLRAWRETKESQAHFDRRRGTSTKRPARGAPWRALSPSTACITLGDTARLSGRMHGALEVADVFRRHVPLTVRPMPAI